MGFFSWNTQNTNRSICNTSSSYKTFPVVMVDDKGNKYYEDYYEGYGVFGGKDFYELLAEMNGVGTDRDAGISLVYSGRPYISPNLYEVVTDSEEFVWVDEDPTTCKYQGFFY